jgi:hypothetical protein
VASFKEKSSFVVCCLSFVVCCLLFVVSADAPIVVMDSPVRDVLRRKLRRFMESIFIIQGK